MCSTLHSAHNIYVIQGPYIIVALHMYKQRSFNHPVHTHDHTHMTHNSSHMYNTNLIANGTYLMDSTVSFSVHNTVVQLSCRDTLEQYRRLHSVHVKQSAAVPIVRRTPLYMYTHSTAKLAHTHARIGHICSCACMPLNAHGDADPTAAYTQLVQTSKVDISHRIIYNTTQ
jgi:hypothetical protein